MKKARLRRCGGRKEVVPAGKVVSGHRCDGHDALLNQ
jgi:hypothetical protein